MKILIFVDYASKEFNKDFQLSNILLEDNSVFLVTSNEQLKMAEKHYDILLLGYSFNHGTSVSTSLKIYSIQDNDKYEDIIHKIKEFQ